MENIWHIIITIVGLAGISFVAISFMLSYQAMLLSNAKLSLDKYDKTAQRDGYLPGYVHLTELMGY